MVGIIIAIIATLVIAVPVSAYVANTRSKKAMEITIGNAEDKAREIIDEAIKAAAVSYTHLTLPTILLV